MTTRRLVAIMASDVVSYSTMIDRDEEATLAKIKALQRERRSDDDLDDL